ncbi:hypothetical protein MHYP_G00073990 [Metynnis hypsauchen]
MEVNGPAVAQLSTIDHIFTFRDIDESSSASVAQLGERLRWRVCGVVIPACRPGAERINHTLPTHCRALWEFWLVYRKSNTLPRPKRQEALPTEEIREREAVESTSFASVDSEQSHVFFCFNSRKSHIPDLFLYVLLPSAVKPDRGERLLAGRFLLWTYIFYEEQRRSDMSGQGILNSVFSCSSAGAKTFPKRKLRQTRSLDPALMRSYGTEVDERGPAGPRLSQTPADHLKRSTAWDLPLSLSVPAQPVAAGNIFSPKKWLQKSVPQVDDLDTFSYSVWKSGVRLKNMRTDGIMGRYITLTSFF